MARRWQSFLLALSKSDSLGQDEWSLPSGNDHSWRNHQLVMDTSTSTWHDWTEAEFKSALDCARCTRTISFTCRILGGTASWEMSTGFTTELQDSQGIPVNLLGESELWAPMSPIMNSRTRSVETRESLEECSKPSYQTRYFAPGHVTNCDQLWPLRLLPAVVPTNA